MAKMSVDDKKWETRSDVEALERVGEIMMSPERKNRAKAEIAKKKKATDKAFDQFGGKLKKS